MTLGVGTLDLIEKVLLFNKNHKLITPESTILIAVSGGPDSMALLHFFVQMRSSYQLNLVALSVDHQLRGEESKEDLKYVEEICRKWDVTFIGTSVDVLSYSKEKKKGVELAARELRYQFFKTVMKDYEQPLLAMGHHGDDQVETIFMQLMNGIKAKGMPYKRTFANGMIIRPFLCLTKKEIEEYCTKNQLQPRIDQTNEDTIYTRNAIRHHILPFLKERNPNIHRMLQLTSEVIQTEEDYLQQEAKKAMEQVVTFEKKKRTIHMDINKAISLHLALQRKVFHLILNYLYEGMEADIQTVHIEQLVQGIHSEKPNITLYFPKELRVVKAYHTLTFTFDKEEKEDYTIPLHPGEETTLPGGMRIRLELFNEKPAELGENQFVCDATNIPLPIFIRTRQKGDKIKVRGLNGHKKIKDIFIDEKVPKGKRDTWPIVTDSHYNILWVIGLKKGAVSETEGSNQWLRLSVNNEDI